MKSGICWITACIFQTKIDNRSVPPAPPPPSPCRDGGFPFPLDECGVHGRVRSVRLVGGPVEIDGRGQLKITIALLGVPRRFTSPIYRAEEGFCWS